MSGKDAFGHILYRDTTVSCKYSKMAGLMGFELFIGTKNGFFGLWIMSTFKSILTVSASSKGSPIRPELITLAKKGSEKHTMMIRKINNSYRFARKITWVLG